MSQFERSELIFGADGIKKLNDSHIAVFGIGGVGSFVCEALCRQGIGTLTFVDCDTVSESNLNRQLVALHSTIGMKKTEVMKNRCIDINPNVKIHAVDCFFDKSTCNNIDFDSFDYIVDCIDTVTSKLLLAEIATKEKIPIISSMGTGNKLEPTRFQISDISKTVMCPLARVMRRELKERHIFKLKVLWSDEKPVKTDGNRDENGKSTPGSVSFVPSVAGLIIAGEVIKDILNKR